MTTLRVAVTGLKRAGKTVFLTALINHLLEGNEDSLAAFRDAAVTFSGRVLPQDEDRPVFPYHLYLDLLRQNDPVWPERTAEMSQFRLAVDLRNLRTRKTRSVQIELVDYPGERLLDLPMLSLSFEDWSDRVVRDAEVGQRRGLSAEWLEGCDRIEAGANGKSPAVAEAVDRYAAYVRACREAGLTFLQPSAMLPNGAEPGAPPCRLSPLPVTVRKKAPALSQEFTRRYRVYVHDHVKPFVRAVGRCSRQIVLVDVMSVLRQGVHSYNDTRRCLRSVLDAYAYAEQRHRFSPLRLMDAVRPRIERVVFAATKADQCTRATRGNLRYLLEELVDQKRRQLIATLPRCRPKITFCAACRVTEDATKQYDGRELSCLRGVRADREPDKEGPWFPGEVPMEWPEDDWNPEEEQFVFPDFLPRRLVLRDGAIIPHANLDKVFWHVIEDLVT